MTYSPTRTETGAKARQVTIDEKWMAIQLAHRDYGDWHRKLPSDCVYFDVDAIEWRTVGAEQRPVAIIERSVYVYKRLLARSDLQEPLERFQSYQQKYTIRLAEMLNCPAYFVVFTGNLREFHVWNVYGLSSYGWRPMDRAGHGDWIAEDLLDDYLLYLEQRKNQTVEHTA